MANGHASTFSRHTFPLFPLTLRHLYFPKNVRQRRISRFSQVRFTGGQLTIIQIVAWELHFRVSYYACSWDLRRILARSVKWTHLYVYNGIGHLKQFRKVRCNLHLNIKLCLSVLWYYVFFDHLHEHAQLQMCLINDCNLLKFYVICYGCPWV